MSIYNENFRSLKCKYLCRQKILWRLHRVGVTSKENWLSWKIARLIALKGGNMHAIYRMNQ